MHERALTHVARTSCMAGLHGALIRPGDDGYDSARRVWNGRIDKYPALICRCADRSDVMRAVAFAHQYPLPVAVRGGGHSFSGHAVCEGGLVIDLSQMKGIQVDPVKRTARAEAGLTLGEFVSATEAFGLATTTGAVAGTGIAGLTLGGGIGWFMGKYGLTIDNVLSVDIVTADGRVLTASETAHPDLFWGVRGGGGNFGIVTAFEFQLHPIGPVLAGKVVYPLAQAREVLRFYREYTRSAPDEVTAYASLLTTPDGQRAMSISLCYCGPLDEGRRLVEPVRSWSRPLVETIRPKSYFTVITQANAGAPDGRSYEQKACTLSTLSDEAIETLATAGAACTSPFSQVLIQHLHGAASRVGPTETAFALREESYVVSLVAAWKDGQADRHRWWVETFWGALQPYTRSGVYVNFLNEEEDGQVQATYGVNYERLVALKKSYDPTNFFSRNQNIRPPVEEVCPVTEEGASKQNEAGSQPLF